MHYAMLLVFLLTVPALTQTPEPVAIPTKADWVGPLEFEDSRGRNLMPTRVSLSINGDNVTGEWHAETKSRPSGQVTGTIDAKGRFDLTVTFYSAGEVTRIDGTKEVVGVERCSGAGRFQGAVTAAGLFRWTSTKVTMDTPVKRLQERDCEDITRLIWTLQLHHP